MTTPSIAPDRVLSYLDDKAVQRLRSYYTTDITDTSGFTGGQFEFFAGGGDRSEVADRFTSDDIVAVSLLSVRVPGRAAYQLIADVNGEFARLLAAVPIHIDLWDVDAADVAPGSAAVELWTRLIGLTGIGAVTAGKLLARKRPRLIPVYDRVVQAALDLGDAWWLPLRECLANNPEIVDALAELRQRADLDHRVSLLRILDVCIWMKDHGQIEPAPDAEG